MRWFSSLFVSHYHFMKMKQVGLKIASIGVSSLFSKMLEFMRTLMDIIFLHSMLCYNVDAI